MLLGKENTKRGSKTTIFTTVEQQFQMLVSPTSSLFKAEKKFRVGRTMVPPVTPPGPLSLKARGAGGGADTRTGPGSPAPPPPAPVFRAPQEQPPHEQAHMSVGEPESTEPGVWTRG